VDAALALQEVSRARQLVEAGAVSQQAVDRAVAASDAADAQVQVMADQISQQLAELAYHAVVAPTAGTIGDVPVTVGDRVTRATVLTSIEAAGGLEVYVNVPVQQAPALRQGLPVRLVDDAGALIGETAVSFVAASVDDATQSVLVLAPVPAGVALRADQYVRARLVWADEPQLRVPVLAVQRFGGQFFVFVAEETPDGVVARQRPVTLGPIAGDAYPVLEGLAAGDRLVVAGTQKIGDGMPVQALPSMPPPGADPEAAGAPGAGGQ
jgi:RND family efflux transporter MFP subunit